MRYILRPQKEVSKVDPLHVFFELLYFSLQLPSNYIHTNFVSDNR